MTLAEKRELAARLLRERASRTEEVIDASHVQRSLWLHHRLDPAGAAYHVAFAARICGACDIPALRRALQALVDRHGSLRATFLEDGAVLRQRIPARSEVSFDVVEAGNVHLHTAVEEAYRRPFDLARGPLFRAHLWTLSPENRVLLLVAHHIAMDGWSLVLLLDELRLLYPAERDGVPVRLPRAEAGYGEFVRRQREWLAGADGTRSREYWQGRLAGDLPRLDLPSDHPRPAVQTFRGGTHRFVIEPALHEKLRQLARGEGVTLYVLLLAAYHTLLHLRSGQSDVIVGSPVSGRSGPEFERLAGCLINMVAIRGDLRGDPTFRELLASIRAEVAGALAHQDYPFQRLVEEMPQRDAGHAPVFQTSFVLQNLQHAWGVTELFDRHARGEIADLGGLALEPYAVDQQEGQLDLTVELLETPTGLAGICRYNSDLFDPSTASRLMEHYAALLAAIFEAPATPLSRLPRMTATERDLVTRQWPFGPVDSAPALPFPALVDTWAERTPDASAIEFGDEHITYAELTGLANALAHHLRAMGCGPETLCAICLDRTPRMVIAVLAVWKAGGAYVPLDPAYPADRLAYMLSDSGAEIVITESAVRCAVPATSARVIVLDEVTLTPCDDPPAHEFDPEQLAYVIYTSGSTGRPKGVELVHRGLNNLVPAQQAALGLQSTDRALQFASFSFDASVFEMAMALGSGGTLVMACRENLLPGPGLIEVLRSRRITAVILPPSALAVMDAAVLPDLRLVTVGGEECPADLVNRWAPGRRFLNLYGPTESTIWATAEECAVGIRPAIGRPVLNTNIHVLDGRGEPVPCGAPGELYIGGAGVARGYRHRPDLTAERFVEYNGARVYRSGDLARWRSDGRLEFLGRADQQVKLRGYRIELGEIEAVMREYPGVREAAVAARAGHLAGYAVPSVPPGLLDHLRARLPDYMVPASLNALDALPLSLNGKVDRARLPQPQTVARTAPRTTLEAVVTRCFADVLHQPDYGVHDDFFVHGGHSLLATQLLSRLRDAVQEELPLRAVFESPTPAAIAARIASDRHVQPLPAIVEGPRGAVRPLSFAQERLWFLHQLDPASAAFNIPAALRFRGQFDAARVERALQSILARHDTLRASFATVEGRAEQRIAEAVEFHVPVVEGDVARLAEEQAMRPFDLSEPPLIRALLVRESPESHVLLVTMHHIVSDGWSTGVFLREFAAAYSGKPLPPRRIQYSDYAHWQRGWLRGEVIESQSAFWKQQLAEMNAAPLLPAKVRQALPAARAGVCAFRLERSLTAAAQEFNRAAQATLFHTLLAAFQSVLSRYTGSTDVVCGSPIANRNHTGTEDLIGFFVNMLVLRNDLAGNPAFRELAQRVKASTLAAMANQDVPFEVLVDQLHPQRDLSRSPLFQITFALHNVPMELPHIPGLLLEKVEDTARTTRYEIEAHLWESDGAIEGFLLYRPDLFEPKLVAGLAAHFRSFLEAALAQPDRPIEEIDVLSPGERRRLLGEDALPAYEPACLHARFEAQVQTRGDAIAVTYGEESLTYRELDRYANRLAHALQSRGVTGGQRVGLLAERSMGLIAAMLAILKAGAAYVPIDPAYPKDRLAFMIDDAELDVIVTQEAFLARLPDASAALCLDRDRAHIESFPAEPCSGAPDPTSTAYVIYTSGSTGKPKGVEVTHANVSRIFDTTREWFRFDEHDTWTMFHSAAFDFSVWEIWGALLHGGRLVVVPYAVSRSPEAFHQLVCDEGVTVLNQTPSAFRQFQHAALATSQCGDRLRLVIFGGEALDFRSLARWFDRFGDSRPQLVNMYGITETTIHVTYRPLRAVDAHCGESLVGRPLPDLRLHILDSRMRVAPPGIPGEIYVGGAGVSRGYLNRPELNRERFVPDPFRPGETLYRSGDSGRLLPSGDIEYLGRLDHQVQLHGFRVELGEIEAALTASPLVRDAVALLRDERIVAWIVPQPGADCSVTALRAALRDRLPEYMIPSAFVPIDALPLTTNGKVAYAALPDPGAERPNLDAAFAAPRTEVERAMAAVWSEVLRVATPGIHDNFFELGGDSILSIQVVAKASQAGLRITPKQLFQNQTIAQLAAVAETAAAPAVDQGPATGEFPLTPIQRWFAAQRLEDPHHWNQSVVLRLNRPIDPAVLDAAFHRLMLHHDALRLRLRDGRGYIADLDGESCFAIFDAAEFEYRAAELQASLDLEQGPLARFALFGDLLLLIVHHLAVDGVSWRILLEDLATLCAGGELPPKTVSYRDWASSVAGLPDFPAPAEESTEGDLAIVSTSLDASATRDLLTRLPLAASCRPDEAMLAALAAVLGPVAVNLEGHGRDAADLDVSRTVGWFTRIIPLQLERHFEPSRLIDRAPRAATAPEVSFNYLGQFDQALPASSPFTLTSIRAGADRSPRARRAHRIDISAAVFDGCLRIDWAHRAGTDIRSLAERYVAALREWIDRYLGGLPEGTSDVYRLAPQQQGMLLESLAARGGGVHVEQLTCILEGPLDVGRFRDAWRSVVRRHPSLRTCFAWRNRPQPVQIVLENAEPEFETGDWSTDAVTEYVAATRARGFDLDRAPLMRLALFRLGENRHRFVWTQHHAILDGWSQPLVMGDVLRCYRDGGISHRAPGYRQYIAWLDRQDDAAAVRFWRESLADFTRATPLGSIAQQPAATDSYQSIELAIPADITRKLEAAAQAHRVTLGSLVLGVWALLLARYSGDDDVLFGMTVSGRPANLEDSQNIVGLLSNTLPLRMRVPREQPFWEFIEAVQRQQTEIRAYEAAPARAIRAVCEVPAGEPLHHSIVAFENYPTGALTEGLDLAIRDLSFDGARTQQSVAILATPGECLSLKFVFDRRRIAPGAIPEHFARMLEYAAETTATIAELHFTISTELPQHYATITTAAAYTAPTTPLEHRLAALWSEILGAPRVGIHDNFFELGGHSLLAFDLVSRIRNEFGRELSLAALLEAPTIAALARILESDEGSLRSPLIVIAPGRDRMPVTFMPGAGGNVVYFHPLASLLGPDQPFWAIQARGLDAREPILADVEEVAAYNVEALRRKRAHGPYLLGGHSFGCMVSLEMALQLQAQGEEVPQLVILDDMAPVPGRIPPDDLHYDLDAVWLYKILRLAERLKGATMSLAIEDLLRLGPEQQLDLAMHKLKSIDYLPRETDRAMAHRYVELFKTNFRASFRYTARKRYEGRVTLFRARDPKPDDPILAYSRAFFDDPTWGWSNVADRVDVRWAPGDHISMMAEPHVRDLAGQLRGCL